MRTNLIIGVLMILTAAVLYMWSLFKNEDWGGWSNFISWQGGCLFALGMGMILE